MKKLTSFIVLLLALIQMSRAQSSYDVLNKDIPITFFGIDFSNAKGIMLNASSDEVVKRYMPAINQLLINESNKFSISKAFNKSTVNYDFTDVTKQNALIDINNFQFYDDRKINPIENDAIALMIQKYSLTGKTGTGLVFIAQKLDKSNRIATYNLVFFTLPEGKIILNQSVTGKPMGFGFRNYWANTIYYILKNEIGTIKSKYNK